MKQQHTKKDESCNFNVICGKEECSNEKHKKLDCYFGILNVKSFTKTSS